VKLEQLIGDAKELAELRIFKSRQVISFFIHDFRIALVIRMNFDVDGIPLKDTNSGYSGGVELWIELIECLRNKAAATAQAISLLNPLEGIEQAIQSKERDLGLRFSPSYKDFLVATKGGAFVVHPVGIQAQKIVQGDYISYAQNKDTLAFFELARIGKFSATKHYKLLDDIVKKVYPDNAFTWSSNEYYQYGYGANGLTKNDAHKWRPAQLPGCLYVGAFVWHNEPILLNPYECSADREMEVVVETMGDAGTMPRYRNFFEFFAIEIGSMIERDKYMTWELDPDMYHGCAAKLFSYRPYRIE
jgi:hypothetical protein